MRPRRTADEEANEATNRVFKAKIRIMDIMKNRPDAVDSLLSYAEDRVSNYTKARPNNKPTDDVRWPATYITIAKLPKYWRAQHLAAHGAHIGLTAAVVDQLDKPNPSAVNNLWEFFMALTPTAKLPRPPTDLRSTVRGQNAEHRPRDDRLVQKGHRLEHLRDRLDAAWVLQHAEARAEGHARPCWRRRGCDCTDCHLRVGPL